MQPIHWIDAHGHVPLDTPDAADWHNDFGISSAMNICVAHDDLGGLAAQRGWYRALSSADPSRWAWATSFSLEGFGGPDWAERAIAGLAADYEDPGRAAGCKVWKNIGMELKDPATGDWVYLDDPRFAPIFRWLERQGRPLLTHIAEPIQAWLPLDPANPHHGYFSRTPKWHWHGRNDVPSHERLIASRDAIVERYPRLPVVGLHFGSQEHDLTAVAQRLDRWPNYFVDTAARLGDLVVHAGRDRASLIDFLLRYRDRILWGVDFVIMRPISSMTGAEQTSLRQRMAAYFALERRFFSTTETIDYVGRRVRGLGLDDATLQPLVRTNARRLYWGHPAARS